MRFIILKKRGNSEKSDTTPNNTPLSHFSFLFSVHSFLVPLVPSLNTGGLRAYPAPFLPYIFLSFLIYTYTFNNQNISPT